MRKLNYFILLIPLLMFNSCGDLQEEQDNILSKIRDTKEDKVADDEPNDEEIDEYVDSDGEEETILFTCKETECELPVSAEENSIVKVMIINEDSGSIDIETNEVVELEIDIEREEIEEVKDIEEIEEDETENIEVIVGTDENLIIQSEDIPLTYELTIETDETVEDEEYTDNSLDVIIDEVSNLNAKELDSVNVESFYKNHLTSNRDRKIKRHYLITENRVTLKNLIELSILRLKYRSYYIKISVYDLELNRVLYKKDKGEKLSLSFLKSIAYGPKMIILEAVSE